MRRIILIAGAALLVGLAYFSYTRYYLPAQSPTPTPEVAETLGRVIYASGTVLPERWANISFDIQGTLAYLPVQEGDRVEQGQLLAELDTIALRGQVAQAQAALETARARLAQVRAGARPEEIKTAEQDVAAARAALEAAQAEVAAAEAELARLLAGAKEEEITAAKADMKKAEAVLRQAQAEYDKIAAAADVAARPEAVALEQASLDYEAAKARYEALLRGATKEEVDAARARLAAAQAQASQAKAHLGRAQAQLDLLRAGPTTEQVAVAEGEVSQAEVTLAGAQVALSKARLYAPFSATVGVVHVREGEEVLEGQPVLVFGDISHLRVETTDLRETDVSSVILGQQVEVTFDALPGEVLPGKVVRIAPMARTEQGSANYTAVIELTEMDPRIRWGMTAYVNIPVNE
jgi:HlyD family secretion protein